MSQDEHKTTDEVSGRRSGAGEAPTAGDAEIAPSPEPHEPPQPPEPPESGEPEPPPTQPADPDGFRLRHPDALRLEMTVGGAVLGILTFVALVVSILLVGVAGLSPWLPLVALSVPLLLVFPFLIVPRWSHQRYRYRVDDRGLEVRRGIWWRSHRFIAHTRLQHTDVAQGPLERYFGLANLVVHTAGTHEAKTTVTGLSLETAKELRDRLTGEPEDDGEAGADGV